MLPLRTPELIEEGLREIMHEVLQGICTVKKSSKAIGESRLTLNPYLVFNNIAVGDIKYKIGDDWVRSDLYQAIAFAVGYGVLKCALIGFSPRDESPLSKLRVGEIEVAQFRWVTAPEVTPELAQSKIAE